MHSNSILLQLKLILTGKVSRSQSPKNLAKSAQWGNLTFLAAILTEVDAIFIGNDDNPAVHLGWSGAAWCAGGGTSVLVADWKKDPTKYKKLRGNLISAGAGAGGTSLFFYSLEDDTLVGETTAAGAEIGACVLDKEFKVNKLTSTTLTPKNKGQRYRATSAADFYIFDRKIKYGQDSAPTIKKFGTKGSDHISFSARLAKNLPSIDEIQLKTVQSSKKLEKASRKGFDFIYFQPEGHLYHDTNSEKDGLGEGGLMAVLDGSPDLDASSFHIMA